MQPDSALDSWRQWIDGLRSRPTILGPLTAGRSNRSFLLDSDGSKMVLRLNSSASALPSANRNSEIDIWRAASKQGIAPPLLHVDEQNTFLVSAYINNSLPQQPPLMEAFVEEAFCLLKKCHQLNVHAPNIDYASHIGRYWQIIENRETSPNPSLEEQREPMQLVLDALLDGQSQTGLCHHDPIIANFVGGTSRLYLIDWEYAAHGLVVMDYAALATEWGIDDATILKHSGVEPDVLKKAKTLYKYLCALWEEVIT